MRIEITTFRGANRALHRRLLPDGVGVESFNQQPGRGDLRPWNLPLPVATIPTSSQTKTIYRMGRDVASESQYWLSWSTVVHCMRSFDANDTTEKTYYTGDGVPKWTNNAIGLGSPPYPQAWRPLGVPGPISAPLVTVTTDTTTGDLESRYYFSTFVTDQGEESQPSPPSTVVTCHPGAVLSISSLEAPPSGQTIFTARRIYVTNTGTSGTAQALFLREIPIGNTSTTDDGRARGEVMPSTTWAPPPADGKWLTALWNGIAAMLSGKSLRFCETNLAYAWPIGYELLLDDAGVGMAAFDQSLVVLTTGKPYVVTGSDPSSMNSVKLTDDAACISERSIIGMGHGVVWAGNDGLHYMGATGSGNVTATLMLQEDWAKLKPETIIGTRYGKWYFGFYDDGSGGKGFFIDPLNPADGLFFLDKDYDAAYFDSYTAQLYVADAGQISRWDGGGIRMTSRFVSKTERAATKCCPRVAQIVADSFPCVFTLFASDRQIFSAPIYDGDPFRLPSGYLSDEFRVQIENSFGVQGVVLATSMSELG